MISWDDEQLVSLEIGFRFDHWYIQTLHSRHIHLLIVSEFRSLYNQLHKFYERFPYKKRIKSKWRGCVIIDLYYIACVKLSSYKKR